ncbi:ISKra4 family transposase [Ktedonobacter robiniae]|uniref:ISKra4 family transposase n=1 Tax=Ktedonobacter robiniae TaxID=2778365 RepID=UPI0019166D81|nr:ISKra4 family transposase [Ktedonobacter robiniae]
MLPGSLAPRQQEHLVHLASVMPFEHASSILNDLLGVYVSGETARRLSEQVGKHVEHVQTTQAYLPDKQEAILRFKALRLAMSADGAMVPLVGGEWAEVRTLAIGEVPATGATNTTLATVHVGKLSYFSRLSDSATFIDLAEVETRRRHLVGAKEVCAIMDGAEWLQGMIDVHRPDAVRIPDFPHAAEHVAKLLEALSAQGTCFPENLLQRCLHVLKERGPATLAKMAAGLSEEEISQPEVREHLGYLQKRCSQMQYLFFRQAGWPLGSGMVESANKLVVERRLKGPGMRWERHDVNPMLALRNGICNERWQETWQLASSQRRKERRHLRCQRAAQRLNPLSASGGFCITPHTHQLKQGRGKKRLHLR